MAKTEEVMAFFWKRFSKDEAGRKVVRFKDGAELELLYRAGFVDVAAHTIEQWKDAFAEHRQKDGSFLLGEKEWMGKLDFLASPKGALFDPMALREGSWDPAEFDRLIEEKILPSLLVDPEEFRKLIKPLREKSTAAGGQVTIGKPFKTALQSLLEQFPSPLRLLQVQFAASAKPSPATGFAQGKSEAQSAVNRLDRLLGRN